MRTSFRRIQSWKFSLCSSHKQVGGSGADDGTESGRHINPVVKHRRDPRFLLMVRVRSCVPFMAATAAGLPGGRSGSNRLGGVALVHGVKVKLDCPFFRSLAVPAIEVKVG